MDIYGLTGGIASGKSTVARLFEEQGAKVVDADTLAREVVMPGSDALVEIISHFGEGILLTDGSLNRKELGAIVFADPVAREVLNKITHPRIAVAGQEAMRRLAEEGESIAIYEAALIVEKGLHKSMQGLIVVTLPESEQIERLMQRDDLDREAAKARVDSQLPLSAKVEVADFIIDNSGSPAASKAQVADLWRRIGYL